MASLSAQTKLQDGHAQLVVLNHVTASSTYKVALGSSHWRDLSRLHTRLGGTTAAEDAPHVEQAAVSEDDNSVGVTKEPPTKKQKLLVDSDSKTPVRVICSASFLSHVRCSVLALVPPRTL